MQPSGGFVYILSNFKRTVFYTGVTSNLIQRVYQHKYDLVEGFTKKYRVHYLVYCEQLDTILTAIEREKQIKGWNRDKKINFIKKSNPTLEDLYSNLI